MYKHFISVIKSILKSFYKLILSKCKIKIEKFLQTYCNGQNKKSSFLGWIFEFDFSVGKLLFKFTLVAAGGNAPLAKMLHLAVGATGNNGVVALKLQRSVLMVNNMSLSVKALAAVVTGVQFVDFHGVCSLQNDGLCRLITIP